MLAENDPASDEYGMLRAEYRSGSDSHPNLLANETTGPLFAQFLHSRLADFLDVNENPAGTPDNFAISAHPNPFNSAVSVTVDCSRSLINQTPTVEIYDVNGRRIDVIPDPDRESRGASKNLDSRFHGNDKMFIWQPGENTGSGVYLIKAKMGERTASKRAVYLK